MGVTMPTLRDYQIEGAHFLGRNPRAMLLDDPGLGKTAQALTAAVGKTLVVCPATVRDVWKEEAKIWAPELDLLTVSFAYTRKTESLWKSQHYDTLIVDEAHRIKGRGNQQTEGTLRIADRSDNVWQLTGTPIRNWGYEMFNSIKLLHSPGNTNYTSFWRWAEYWFDVSPGSYSNYEIKGLHPWWTWADFIRWNDLDKLTIARKREDVQSELPPLTQIEHLVHMTRAQTIAYKELYKDFLTFIDSEPHSALSEGGRWVKLRKVTTDLRSVSPKYRGPLGGKLELVTELIEESRGRPIVLFAYYHPTLDTLTNLGRLTRRPVYQIDGRTAMADRTRLIKKFQASQTDGPILVASIETMSEGVTLTAADTCVIIERSVIPTTNEQAMYRLLRIGQTRPVTVHTLVTKGTVDEGLSWLLAKKSTEQRNVLSARDLMEVMSRV